MDKLTFDQLPAAVTQLLEDVATMREGMRILLNEKKVAHEDEVLDVSQAAKFLGLAVPTVYALNSKGELPSMKRSKKLYFLKKDLIDYLKQGRRQSQAEIEADASHILKQKKRGAK